MLKDLQNTISIHDEGAYLVFLRCSGVGTPLIRSMDFCYSRFRRIYQTVNQAWATQLDCLPNRQAITVTCHLSHQRASIRRHGGGEEYHLEYGAFKTNGVIAPKVREGLAPLTH